MGRIPAPPWVKAIKAAVISKKMSRIISGEDQVLGGHGTREMPVWGPIFSRVDSDQDLGRVRIDNLARYLRELQVSR